MAFVHASSSDSAAAAATHWACARWARARWALFVTAVAALAALLQGCSPSMLPPEASIDSDFSCSEDKFVCNSPDKHICRTEEIKCFSIDFECDPASGDFKCSAKGKTDFCEREQKECMGEEEVSHTHPKTDWPVHPNRTDSDDKDEILEDEDSGQHTDAEVDKLVTTEKPANDASFIEAGQANGATLVPDTGGGGGAAPALLDGRRAKAREAFLELHEAARSMSEEGEARTARPLPCAVEEEPTTRPGPLALLGTARGAASATTKGSPALGSAAAPARPPKDDAGAKRGRPIVPMLPELDGEGEQPDPMPSRDGEEGGHLSRMQRHGGGHEVPTALARLTSAVAAGGGSGSGRSALLAGAGADGAAGATKLSPDSLLAHPAVAGGVRLQGSRIGGTSADSRAIFVQAHGSLAKEQLGRLAS